MEDGWFVEWNLCDAPCVFDICIVLDTMYRIFEAMPLQNIHKKQHCIIYRNWIHCKTIVNFVIIVSTIQLQKISLINAQWNQSFTLSAGSSVL